MSSIVPNQTHGKLDDVLISQLVLAVPNEVEEGSFFPILDPLISSIGAWADSKETRTREWQEKSETKPWFESNEQDVATNHSQLIEVLSGVGNGCRNYIPSDSSCQTVPQAIKLSYNLKHDLEAISDIASHGVYGADLIDSEDVCSGLPALETLCEASSMATRVDLVLAALTAKGQCQSNKYLSPLLDAITRTLFRLTFVVGIEDMAKYRSMSYVKQRERESQAGNSAGEWSC